MNRKKAIISAVLIFLIVAVSVFSVYKFADKGQLLQETKQINGASVKTEVLTQSEEKEIKKVQPEKSPEIKEEKKAETENVEKSETTVTEDVQDETGASEQKEKPEEVKSETVSEEEREEVREEKKNTLICSLTVRCDSVLDKMDKLSEGKRAIIPSNGIFLSKENIVFSEGESVFDILKKELKAGGIHLEYVKNPMYNSVYVEGIGNLYEFDMGDMSGWIYKVNGVKPTYGSSQYKIKPGDAIEFIYSCNYMEE